MLLLETGPLICLHTHYTALLLETCAIIGENTVISCQENHVIDLQRQNFATTVNPLLTAHFLKYPVMQCGGGGGGGSGFKKVTHASVLYNALCSQ